MNSILLNSIDPLGILRYCGRIAVLFWSPIADIKKVLELMELLGWKEMVDGEELCYEGWAIKGPDGKLLWGRWFESEDDAIREASRVGLNNWDNIRAGGYHCVEVSVEVKKKESLEGGIRLTRKGAKKARSLKNPDY